MEELVANKLVVINEEIVKESERIQKIENDLEQRLARVHMLNGAKETLELLQKEIAEKVSIQQADNEE